MILLIPLFLAFCNAVALTCLIMFDLPAAMVALVMIWPPMFILCRRLRTDQGRPVLKVLMMGATPMWQQMVSTHPARRLLTWLTRRHLGFISPPIIGIALTTSLAIVFLQKAPMAIDDLQYNSVASPNCLVDIWDKRSRSDHKRESIWTVNKRTRITYANGRVGIASLRDLLQCPS